jgi:aerotaxis receptor
MNNKNLNIRYFIYFLISLFLLILLINFFKKSEIEYSLNNYKQFVDKEYSKYYSEYKNSSELIYFNEFVKEKDFIGTFKNINSLNIENKKREIYNHLKISYSFYKTLDISDINFYSSSNEFLLSMQDKPQNKNTSLLMEKILLNKQELNSFIIVDNNYYLIFSKPIFDENLNFLGVINIEFDFKSVIKKLENSSDFLFTNIMSNKIKFDESFYFNLPASQKKSLISDIKQSKNFVLLTKEHSSDFPLVFLQIFKSQIDESSLYLVAYNTNKDSIVAKINKYFDFLFIIISFFIFIIFYLLYRLKYFKIQTSIINKKYLELYSYIDDYVIMVETDLNGIITYATKPFCKISGYSRKELLEKNINLLKHPDMSKGFFKKLWTELHKNKIWEGEIKNQDRYGNSYWVSGIIIPKYDFNNEIIGYISIRANITDTKQLEKINKLLKEDLSNKLNEIKMKDQTLIDNTKVQLMSKILDSLGHQWKQPILSISSLLYNLKIIISNEEKNQNKLELIKQTQIELKSLSEVLNEIKYLFQENEEQKSKFSDVIKEAILSIQEELELNNIKVKYDLNSQINIDISFNELKNIILNMIKNSIELTKLNNQKEVVIIISAIKEDDLLIKIEDNIKLGDKKINENEDTNNHLYLVKLFVEKNRGLFWFENSLYSTNYYIKLKNGN